MPTLARGQLFDQQGVGCRQCGQPRLGVQHRRDGAQFGRVARARQRGLHCVGQHARQRHAAALPARHDAVVALGQAHVGGHVLQLDQLQGLAGELEAVARTQATDEAFLDRAEAPALGELHGHVAVTGDGADRQPVPECELAIDDAIRAFFVADHAVVVGVVHQRLAALHDEVEHGLPGGGIEVGEGMRAADFREQRIGVEATPERQGHAMLRQDIQRQAWRHSRLDLAGVERLARGGVLDQFQRVGRHAQDVAGFAGTMTRAPGALQQSRHALRAADLDDLVHRREVDAQVQAGGRDHATHAAIAQSLFGGMPEFRVDGAVMQCQHVGVVQPHRLQGLVPQLRLRARVGEQQRAAHTLQARDHALQLRQAQVARPRETLVGLRQQRFQRQRTRLGGVDDRCIGRVRQQGVACLLEVAERRRQSPCAQRRRQRPQARQAELQQHAALAAQQFVPLVDDDGAQSAQLFGGFRIRQQQGERFGRDDEYIGLAVARQSLVSRTGVAGAHRHGPRQAERFDRRAQRTRGVVRQCAQRADPQHARARGHEFAAFALGRRRIG